MSTEPLYADTPVTRLCGRRVRDPDQVSLRRLRETVAGIGDLPRAQAMMRLLESDFPNAHRDYQRVLLDEGQPQEARYLAALCLGRLNTDAATQVLVDSTDIRDAQVLSGILNALGRVGGLRALAAVRAIMAETDGVTARQAFIASQLIAHRLDAQVDDAGWAEGPQVCKEIPRRTEKLQWSLANNADAELCLRSLARRPYGVELLERPMYQVRCARNLWMVVFNRDFQQPRALASLAERKTLLAVVARRDTTTGTYADAYVVLTRPAEDSNGAQIAMLRSGGDVACVGRLDAGTAGMKFLLRSVSGQRPFTLRLEGTLWAGRLELNSATVATGEKSRPVEERWNDNNDQTSA